MNCGVFGRVGWGDWGVKFAELKASVGMGNCRGICIAVEMTAMKIAIGRDLLTLWLLTEHLGLQMVAVSLVCCARKWRLGQWRKLAVVTPWHP